MAEVGQKMAGVIAITGEQDLDKILDEVGSALTVIHFWASWANQCKQMNVVMDELASKYINVKFLKIEAELVPEVSLKYNITAVPTFTLVKESKEIDRVNGANTSLLAKKVNQHSNSPLPVVDINVIEKPTESQEALNERIKKLINSHKCMLFMKGTPKAPECGFSRQIVDILNQHEDVDYGYFNILSDSAIRHGKASLKNYSDWPTYPQLYINGELVGGLDIIKDMISSGEFAAMLPKRRDVVEVIEELLQSSKVLLFMKGSPAEPKCGFSKRACEILNSTGVKYETFDILEDQSIRAGLKVYSNWPTYPQLFVDSQLIGGLDIIAEMHESNDLIPSLKGE